MSLMVTLKVTKNSCLRVKACFEEHLRTAASVRTLFNNIYTKYIINIH